MTGLLMAVLCTRSIGCNNEWHAPGRTNPSFPSPITIKTRIMFSVNMKNLQSIRVFSSEAKLSYYRHLALFYPCSARLAQMVDSFIFRQSPSQDDYYVRE